jgi:hypothetical protein
VTATRPAPQPDERRQSATIVRTSAIRIRNVADQILLDLAHGRMVRANGRLIATEAIALCEAIALLTEAEKAAARQRGEAA